MSNTKRLIWLCPEFTPYYEVLFHALAAVPRMALCVQAMSGPTEAHPYTFTKARPYEWGVADSNVRIDRKLISRILTETDSLVVVASYLKPTLMAAMKALVNRGRRFIYYTDTPLPQDIEWNTDRLRRRSCLRRVARSIRLTWIFQNAYRVLATGKPGVAGVVELGCPKEKVVDFPFWVDLPPLRRPTDLAKDPTTLVGVGQLTFRKGYDVAILAMQRALQDRALGSLQLKLIGQGHERRTLEKLAQNCGLENRVRFTGWLQPSAVMQQLRRSQAFVHPARWDPFPVAVLEAMAAGLPVLGSDQSGSVVDRVADGVTGFVHRVADVKELAEQIRTVLADADTARRMGIAARRKAEQWPPERGAQIIRTILEGVRLGDK